VQAVLENFLRQQRFDSSTKSNVRTRANCAAHGWVHALLPVTDVTHWLAVPMLSLAELAAQPKAPIAAARAFGNAGQWMCLPAMGTSIPCHAALSKGSAFEMGEQAAQLEGAGSHDTSPVVATAVPVVPAPPVVACGLAPLATALVAAAEVAADVTAGVATPAAVFAPAAAAPAAVLVATGEVAVTPPPTLLPTPTVAGAPPPPARLCSGAVLTETVDGAAGTTGAVAAAVVAGAAMPPRPPPTPDAAAAALGIGGSPHFMFRDCTFCTQ